MNRERPAAIAVDVKSIDDTSNFDDFPDVDLKIRESECNYVQMVNYFFSLFATASAPKETEASSKDWVFINYTFKRFEGMTQRGNKTARKS